METLLTTSFRESRSPAFTLRAIQRVTFYTTVKLKHKGKWNSRYQRKESISMSRTYRDASLQGTLSSLEAVADSLKVALTRCLMPSIGSKSSQKIPKSSVVMNTQSRILSLGCKRNQKMWKSRRLISISRSYRKKMNFSLCLVRLVRKSFTTCSWDAESHPFNYLLEQ